MEILLISFLYGENNYIGYATEAIELVRIKDKGA